MSSIAVESAATQPRGRKKLLWRASDGIHASCYVEAVTEADALHLAGAFARFSDPALVTVTKIGPALMPAARSPGRGGNGRFRAERDNVSS